MIGCAHWPPTSPAAMSMRSWRAAGPAPFGAGGERRDLDDPDRLFGQLRPGRARSDRAAIDPRPRRRGDPIKDGAFQRPADEIDLSPTSVRSGYAASREISSLFRPRQTRIADCLIYTPPPTASQAMDHGGTQ